MWCALKFLFWKYPKPSKNGKMSSITRLVVSLNCRWRHCYMNWRKINLFTGWWCASKVCKWKWQFWQMCENSSVFCDLGTHKQWHPFPQLVDTVPLQSLPSLCKFSSIPMFPNVVQSFSTVDPWNKKLNFHSIIFVLLFVHYQSLYV